MKYVKMDKHYINSCRNGTNILLILLELCNQQSGEKAAVRQLIKNVKKWRKNNIKFIIQDVRNDLKVKMYKKSVYNWG